MVGIENLSIPRTAQSHRSQGELLTVPNREWEICFLVNGCKEDVSRAAGSTAVERMKRMLRSILFDSRVRDPNLERSHSHQVLGQPKRQCQDFASVLLLERMENKDVPACLYVGTGSCETHMRLMYLVLTRGTTLEGTPPMSAASQS